MILVSLGGLPDPAVSSATLPQVAMMWRSELSGPYKEHFACFRCRKSFKQPPDADLPERERPAPGERREVRCPQCATPMADLGRDFEAPKQSDARRWKAVELLHRHGVRTAGSAPSLGELKDLEAFLAGRMTESEGERLLREIGKRARDPRPE